jgi:hypothetical protein
MTPQDAPETAGNDERETISPRYHIDLKWYEANSRSFPDMITSRIGEGETEPSKTARKRKASSNPSMADLAKIEGFVNPEMPLLEAAFRLLLVHENKPMDVEQMGQELAERGIGIRDARVVTPETLTRLLDSDSYYGVQRV